MFLNSLTIRFGKFSLQRVCRSFSSVPTLQSVDNAKVTPVSDTNSENDSDIFYEPEKIEPTHGHKVCNLHFRSYTTGALDFYVNFARRAAYHLAIPCSNAVRLPIRTERWTVPRSPFVHKKSQENFERKTHKRLLQLYDANDRVIERLIWILNKECPAGVGIKVTRWKMEELGVGKKMYLEAQETVEEMERRKQGEADLISQVAEDIVKELTANDSGSLGAEDNKQ